MAAKVMAPLILPPPRLACQRLRGAGGSGGRGRGAGGGRVVREEAEEGGVELRNTRHVLPVGSGRDARPTFYGGSAGRVRSPDPTWMRDVRGSGTEPRPYVIWEGGQDTRPTSPGADWAKDARAI